MSQNVKVGEGIETKTSLERLSCILTEDEIMDAGKAAAREVYETGQTEEEKKAAMAQYQSRLKTHRKEIDRLSNMVRSGVEYRKVECETRFDYNLGMKRVTRLDTGEVLESRPMTRDERQMKMEI